VIKAGIQLVDRDFASALMRGLASKGRNICFTLIRDDSEEVDYDLLLTDREPRHSREVCLVSNPDEERIYEGPPYKVFRYQDAGAFISNLLFIYYCETGRNLEFTGEIRCNTLVFTSVSGGIEATALSLLTGEILYKHFGCRCLYLNLCPVDGSKQFLPEGSGKGLLSLLYYLDQGKDFPLESFIRKDSYIDYIDTRLSNPYFDEFHFSQMHRLLKKIDDLGRYTCLILDMGNHLSRCNKKLLGNAEEIFLVAGNQERISASFFSEVKKLLGSLTDGRVIKTIRIDPEKTEAFCLQENGLLDLSSMKQIEWEACRLVKEMMEHAHDH